MRLKEIKKRPLKEYDWLGLLQDVGNIVPKRKQPTYKPGEEVSRLEKPETDADLHKFQYSFVNKLLLNMRGLIKSGYVDINKEYDPDQPVSAGPQIPLPFKQNTDVGEPIKFGGDTYNKTSRGWVNSKGKLADENTAKILDRAFQQDQEAKTKTKPRMRQNPETGKWEPIQSVYESKYEKLNKIFESIILIEEAQPESPREGISVEQYLLNFISPYIGKNTPQQKLDLGDRPNTDYINKLIKEIADSLRKEGGKIGSNTVEKMKDLSDAVFSYRLMLKEPIVPK